MFIYLIVTFTESSNGLYLTYFSLLYLYQNYKKLMKIKKKRFDLFEKFKITRLREDSEKSRFKGFSGKVLAMFRSNFSVFLKLN